MELSDRNYLQKLLLARRAGLYFRKIVESFSSANVMNGWRILVELMESTEIHCIRWTSVSYYKSSDKERMAEAQGACQDASVVLRRAPGAAEEECNWQ